MRHFWRRLCKAVADEPSYPSYTLLPSSRFTWNSQLFQVMDVYRPCRLDGTFELVVRAAPVDDAGEV